MHAAMSTSPFQHSMCHAKKICADECLFNEINNEVFWDDFRER